MNKEELIEFLKENLFLKVERKGGSYGDKPYVEVQLYLNDEMISSDYFSY